jgi:hypothetical protein
MNYNLQLKNYLENERGISVMIPEKNWNEPWDICSDEESCSMKEECDCFDWSKIYKEELSKGRVIFEWDSGLNSDDVEEIIEEWCKIKSMKYLVEYFEISPESFIGSVQLRY